MISQLELQEFVILLENLTVINNSLRSSAERQYEMMKITPESFLPLKLLSVCFFNHFYYSFYIFSGFLSHVHSIFHVNIFQVL